LFHFGFINAIKLGMVEDED